jgi:uncharacterized protein (TIGR02266 family)
MTKRILLVDDAPMFLEIQKDFLKMSTLKILCARDGMEAFSTVKAAMPNLVVMDLYMPKMNGAECCRQIKSDPKLCSIPVIMATSACKEEDHQLCRDAGCNELLIKPFDRSVFLTAVRRYIPELDRRDPRIPFEAKVKFQAFRVSMTGVIKDLSIRGIYVATEYNLDEGTEILLVFSLSEERREVFQAKGVVRWKNRAAHMVKTDYPPGFGVEFTGFQANSFAALQHFLSKQSPRE